MRALVTGVTGCVGRNIVEELLKNNWDVIVVYRKTSNINRLKGLKIELREADLHDLNSVLGVVPENLNAIFHAAGNVSHWHLEAEEQWKDNVLATRNLIQAAKIRNVKRFIFTSTGATFKYANKPLAEINLIKSDYIRTKLLAELEVRKGISLGVDAIIIRPAIVIGKYDYNNYSQIFERIFYGKPSIVLPGIIAFNHATDVAVAHLKAYEKGKTGEAYYLFGNRTDWLDIYQRIAKTMNVKPPSHKTPFWVLYILAYSMLAISYFSKKRPPLTPQLLSLLGAKDKDDPASEIPKTRDDLGFVPSSIDNILDSCYSWMVEEGILQKQLPYKNNSFKTVEFQLSTSEPPKSL